MLDVIHTLYEEDVVAKWASDEISESDVKSKVRTSMYSLLYDREYRYKVHDRSTSRNASPQSEEPELPDLPPESRPTKPYFPPTDPEDLSSVLEGPLG